MIDATVAREQIDAAFRIRRAICAISERQPTYARCVVDQFLRHIAPSMATYRGVDFPATCRRFPGNSERSALSGNKYTALYFHIGNAILGLYEIVEGRECPTLEDRITLLETIARFGLEQFPVDGDDMTGYTLFRRILVEPQPELDPDAIPDTASSTIGLYESGGRTRLRRPEGLVIRPKQGDDPGLHTDAGTV